VGGAAQVGSRPELVGLAGGGDGAGEAEVVSGRVVEQYYDGDMTFYDVALEGVPDPLTLSMKNVVGHAVLERGATARVAWDPRALVLFAD